MTIDKSDHVNPRNRRTMSESDVRQNFSEISNFSNFLPLNSTNHDQHLRQDQQQRSHSLPHRYKNRTFSLTPTSSPASRSTLRSTIYSPDEFRRGVQAMQSWFRSLDDNQRTLAFQSITVR